MVAITLTCNPKFNTYQANQDYLDLLRIKDSFFLNIENKGISIPLIKKQILNTDDFDLVTPINFQQTISGISEELLFSIYSILKNSGAVSCYLQTKDYITSSKLEYINIDRFRKNYYFDLRANEETIISNMKRDAKQRLKKTLKKYTTDIIENIVSEDFYNNYIQISDTNKFSKNYIFSYDQLKGFSKIKGIKYIEIRESGNFFSGGFFGYNNDEVDYLYGADSKDYPDGVRLLIFTAIQYFQKKNFKKLFLGGGISENDSLANFKLRQGTFEQKCSTIRAVLDIKKAEEYTNNKFSKKWFDGFFPPYAEI